MGRYSISYSKIAFSDGWGAWADKTGVFTALTELEALLLACEKAFCEGEGE